MGKLETPAVTGIVRDVSGPIDGLWRADAPLVIIVCADQAHRTRMAFGLCERALAATPVAFRLRAHGFRKAFRRWGITDRFPGRIGMSAREGKALKPMELDPSVDAVHVLLGADNAMTKPGVIARWAVGDPGVFALSKLPRQSRGTDDTLSILLGAASVIYFAGDDCAANLAAGLEHFAPGADPAWYAQTRHQIIDVPAARRRDFRALWRAPVAAPHLREAHSVSFPAADW